MSLILIVEDDHDIREALAEALERAGYRTAGAGNGQEAYDFLLATQELPSLILLDLMMPVMDGWGFREQQLKHVRWKEIPVLVITAGGNAAQKAANMRAQGWLQKPIPLDTLLKAVKELL
jgi:CheY-like chemotaxis protein